jgi:hypothetical protein
MKYKLSFGYINKLTENIAEVVVDCGVNMTMEMLDEYELLLDSIFKQKFGLLINKINNYTYNYEVKLSIASHQNIKAMAVVNYFPNSQESTKELLTLRKIDKWNLREYSGLELGWQNAYDWLKDELKHRE